MKNSLSILFCLFVGVICEKKFDPTKFDYCTLNCGDTPEDVHSACACRVVPPRREILDVFTPQEFRKIMVETHNDIRNWFANGSAQEVYPNAPAATNMRAVNYDLELEYIARCRAVTRFYHPGKPGTNGHDKCRVYHDKKQTGQNISYKNKPEWESFVTLKGWWSEAEGLTETTIDDYSGKNKNQSYSKGIGHFTQFCWADVDLVGCARGTHPELPKKVHRFYLICVYRTTTGEWAGNLVGKKVYKKTLDKTKACSECPDNMKCGEDPRYNALCGPVLPIPQDEPAVLGEKPDSEEEKSSAKVCNGSKLTIYVSCAFLLTFMYQ